MGMQRRHSLKLAAAACVSLVAPVALAAQRSVVLFEIARSKNANVVRYCARLNPRGTLNTDSPIEAFWLMQAEDGRREELTWLERKLAYGFSTSDVTGNGCVLELVAFSARRLRVERAKASYRALVEIRTKPAVLRQIFVQTREGGMLPSVEHVELFGTTLDGRPIRERIGSS
jgi:hypothetical protein